MRSAMPRVDDVGGDVHGPLRVPVPVVADVPVPRDDLAPRNERVAWAPVSARERTRAVPALIAGAQARVGMSSSGGQTESGRAHTGRHHNSRGEPRNSAHGLVPVVRRHPAGVAAVK
jgi:hypothetical protein